MTTDVGAVAREVGTLPAWSAALAVVAHPDDESFGLGAVLDAFARSGTAVSVLCLTRGEASTVSGVTGDLAALRAAELKGAAAALGLDRAELLSYPDRALGSVPAASLAKEITDAIEWSGAQGLVVFDPSGVTGHRDHAAATLAALEAAKGLDLPVLGWTIPRAVAEQLNEEFDTGFFGHEPDDVDLTVAVDRNRQRMASLAHASQAVPTSVLWRRLELLGDVEYLRWLRRSDPATRDSATKESQAKESQATDSATTDSAATAPAATTHSAATEPTADIATMRVEYRDGDRFDIDVRSHRITVDQPVDVGGEDVGPTPTELFVAGLASCVAFYARRYLRRHKLDATGLVVETSYRMGTKPARVAAVDISIQLPHEIPQQRRDGLLAVATHCTVHNSITTEPEIGITLAPAMRP
jgi:LmbE family N-acetylglucosaminyl deacetylase/uncharacterized OsmC-like protein